MATLPRDAHLIRNGAGMAPGLAFPIGENRWLFALPGVPHELRTVYEDIESIYLSGGLASFRSIVEAEIYNHPFANFVPGILRHTDLPEVVRSIAPIRVILAGAVNGSGTTMKTSEVEDLFRSANHVTVRARAEWDVETLSAIN